MLDRDLLDKAFHPPPKPSQETVLAAFAVAALWVAFSVLAAVSDSPGHLWWMVPSGALFTVATWKASRAIDLRARGW